jgi:glycosyltransferase involved in cell wall biosynthesis
MRKVEVSVVVPVFNEGAIIQKTIGVLEDILQGETEGFELILVNDGSSDSTEAIIQNEAGRSPAVVPVNLSRNYGKEAALAAGLSACQGLCVIFIDADLQHPPALIPKMLEKWREGFDVVNARKVSRGKEAFAYRTAAGLFNWIMSREVGSDLAGASDFKLIDRQVADALMRCPERNRFFRGLVAWVGFRTTDVEFDVGPRQAGSTKWSGGMLFRYSLQNLVAFSALPLKVVAYTGFVTAVLGLVLLVQTLMNYILGRAAIGFTTVIAIQIMLGGMILLSQGAIALYVAKMYDEQKARPPFVIRRERAPRRATDWPETES